MASVNEVTGKFLHLPHSETVNSLLSDGHVLCTQESKIPS